MFVTLQYTCTCTWVPYSVYMQPYLLDMNVSIKEIPVSLDSILASCQNLANED